MTSKQWKLKDEGIEWHLIDPKTNDWIARIISGYDGDEANAQFIVQACNSHDELLEVCKLINELCNNYKSRDYLATDFIIQKLSNICTLSKQTIAKADGKEVER